jgi:hypothetical protein
VSEITDLFAGVPDSDPDGNMLAFAQPPVTEAD